MTEMIPPVGLINALIGFRALVRQSRRRGLLYFISFYLLYIKGISFLNIECAILYITT